MNTKLNPYLSFKTNAREAMEFYKGVFGGKLSISTFKDFEMAQDPKLADQVMHSTLEADNGIVFMASDTPPHMEHLPGNSITMALSGDNDGELAGYFEKLSVGGQVTVPLAPAPWGDQYGALADKFGVHWHVNVLGTKS